MPSRMSRRPDSSASTTQSLPSIQQPYRYMPVAVMCMLCWVILSRMEQVSVPTFVQPWAPRSRLSGHRSRSPILPTCAANDGANWHRYEYVKTFARTVAYQAPETDVQNSHQKSLCQHPMRSCDCNGILKVNSEWKQ